MSSAAENAPIGSIIAFAADSIPDTSDTGIWRTCSGQQLGKSDFPDLYKAIGSSNGDNPSNNSFYLPNLQGYFLRGVDDRTTGNIDTDANNRKTVNGHPAPYAPGSVESFSTSLPVNQLQASISCIPTDYHYTNPGDTGPLAYEMGQWVEGAATFTVQSSSKKETVPINMYMYYIIKVLPTATVPVGAVVPFAGQGKEAPSYFDGVWAVCEGDKLPSSRFTKIYAVIGNRYGSTPDGSEFLLPNLQGTFIRGVDINTGRDQNANRTPPPGLPGITASVAGSTQTADNGPPSVPWTVTIQHAPDGNTVHEVFKIAGHTNTRNDDYVFDISWFGGDKETRPVNVAVQYLISLIDHNTVSDNTDTLPIGSIIAFPGVGKPNNKYWALCDGSEVSTVDEQYTKLFKICGSIWGQSESGKFNLPDLRGRFLRGTDNTPDAPVDPDRDNRTNLYPGGATKGTGSAQSFGTSTKNVSANIGRPTRHWDNAAGATANKAMAWNPDSNVYNVQGGDQETRPINIAVFFYVKCYSELV